MIHAAFGLFLFIDVTAAATAAITTMTTTAAIIMSAVLPEEGGGGWDTEVDAVVVGCVLAVVGAVVGTVVGVVDCAVVGGAVVVGVGTETVKVNTAGLLDGSSPVATNVALYVPGGATAPTVMVAVPEYGGSA